MLARLRTRRQNLVDADENANGFTLIELLVVIIIIGILAAIAIPVFLSQKQKGYEASMKSDLRTVAQEVESQNVDTGDYTKTTYAGATAVAGATISGAGQNAGTNTALTLSAGNTITWVGATPSSYCLKATTSKVTGANSPVWYYENTTGGLTQTACTQ